MDKPKKTMDIKERAIAYIMAKGFGVVVLVVYCVDSRMEIKELKTEMNKMSQQVIEIQNTVIKDNTKALSEFVIKTK